MKKPVAESRDNFRYYYLHLQLIYIVNGVYIVNGAAVPSLDASFIAGKSTSTGEALTSGK